MTIAVTEKGEAMSDLINRQDAIDAINKIAPVDTEYDCKLLDRIDVRYVLIELPSAQPEIVRCKDCKRKNAIIEIGMGSGKRIEVLCGVFNTITQSDDFCSYGDRE